MTRDHLRKKQITDKNGKATTVHVNDQRGDGSTNASFLKAKLPTKLPMKHDPYNQQVVIDMYGSVIRDKTVTTKGIDVLRAEGYTVRDEKAIAEMSDIGSPSDGFHGYGNDNAPFKPISDVIESDTNIDSIYVSRVSDDEAEIEVDRTENMLWNAEGDGISKEWLDEHSDEVDEFMTDRYGALVFAEDGDWENARVAFTERVPVHETTPSDIAEKASDINSKFVDESDPGAGGSPYYIKDMKEYVAKRETERKDEYKRDRNAVPVDRHTLDDKTSAGQVFTTFGDGSVGNGAGEQFDGDYVLTKNEDSGMYEPDEFDNDESWEPISGGYTGQWGYNGPVMHDSEGLGGRLVEDVIDNPGVYVQVPAQYQDQPGGERESEGWVILRQKGSFEELQENNFYPNSEDE